LRSIKIEVFLFLCRMLSLPGLAARMSGLALQEDAPALKSILRGRQWAYIECSFAGFESPDPLCPFQLIEVSFLLKNLKTQLPFTYVVQKSILWPLSEGELARRIFQKHGISTKSGNFSFEYVAQMFRDMCVATETHFIFVKDAMVEAAVLAMFQLATGSWFPQIINLEKFKFLSKQLTEHVQPDFSSCRQHDVMTSNSKWYCAQARVQYIFNVLDRLVWAQDHD